MNPFPHDHPIPRRTLLRGAGLGAGLALTGSHGASAAGEMMEPTSAADTPVWSGEYWAIKADVKLNLWRKRAIAPQPGASALPVLFLAHGSSNSARTSFDLMVPGKGEYSLMSVFARYGYDVWTMDHADLCSDPNLGIVEREPDAPRARAVRSARIARVRRWAISISTE
jgi:hypothetical protein